MLTAKGKREIRIMFFEKISTQMRTAQHNSEI